MTLQEAFDLIEDRNTMQHGPYNDYKSAQKKAQGLQNKGWGAVRVTRGGGGAWIVYATKPNKPKATQR